MRALPSILALVLTVGLGLPAAQGPVNPRQPSGSSGGDRQAVPRGAQPAPSGTSGGVRQQPRTEAPRTSEQPSRTRTAVPRTTAPPTGRQDREVLLVPGVRSGARYYYRGRYYPYYPYGTVGLYAGRSWYPSHYTTVVLPYVQPYGSRLGELRLRVRPADAEVYVDGFYAGIVDHFDGVFQSLKLEPEPHHIQVIAPGYEVLEFDVGPAPGGRITYEGDLVPAPFR